MNNYNITDATTNPFWRTDAEREALDKGEPMTAAAFVDEKELVRPAALLVRAAEEGALSYLDLDAISKDIVAAITTIKTRLGKK